MRVKIITPSGCWRHARSVSSLANHSESTRIWSQGPLATKGADGEANAPPTRPVNKVTAVSPATALNVKCRSCLSRPLPTTQMKLMHWTKGLIGFNIPKDDGQKRRGLQVKGQMNTLVETSYGPDFAIGGLTSIRRRSMATERRCFRLFFLLFLTAGIVIFFLGFRTSPGTRSRFRSDSSLFPVAAGAHTRQAASVTIDP